jgi:hypothetical protein
MESYDREQATLCLSEAVAPTLSNARARCSRAEAGWLGMANRVGEHAQPRRRFAADGGVEAAIAIG